MIETSQQLISVFDEKKHGIKRSQPEITKPELDYANKLLITHGPELAEKIVIEILTNTKPEAETLLDIKGEIYKQSSRIETNHRALLKTMSAKKESYMLDLKKQYNDEKINFYNELESKGGVTSDISKKIESSLEKDVAKAFPIKGVRQIRSLTDAYREQRKIDLTVQIMGFPAFEQWSKNKDLMIESQKQTSNPQVVTKPLVLNTFNDAQSIKKDQIARNSAPEKSMLAEVVSINVREQTLYVKTKNSNPSDLIKVTIRSRSPKYDGQRKYQGNIIDNRMSKNFPKGTQVILDGAKEINSHSMSVRWVNKTRPQGYGYLEGLISLLRIKEIYLAQMWRKNTTSYSELQSDSNFKALLLRNNQEGIEIADPWYGYQARIVLDNKIVLLSPQANWNWQTNSPPSYEDAIKLLATYDHKAQQLSKKAHADIAFFENARIARFVQLPDITESQMIEVKADLGLGKSAVGGQSAVNGVLEVTRHEKWGVNVSNAFVGGTKTHIHTLLKDNKSKSAEIDLLDNVEQLNTLTINNA